MERYGKYTIGCRVLNKDGVPEEGLYTFGRYGIAFLCSDINNGLDEKSSIYVFEDDETVKQYIRYISRVYRYEFRQRAKNLKVPVSEFRFYPIRLTSELFDSCIIGGEKNCKIQIKDDKKNKYKFHGNRNKVSIQSIELKDSQH